MAQVAPVDQVDAVTPLECRRQLRAQGAGDEDGYRGLVMIRPAIEELKGRFAIKDDPAGSVEDEIVGLQIRHADIDRQVLLLGTCGNIEDGVFGAIGGRDEQIVITGKGVEPARVC